MPFLLLPPEVQCLTPAKKKKKIWAIT